MLAQVSSDTSTGVIALMGFLVIVFALGFAIAKVQRLRHGAAWKPLLATIDGRVEPGMGPNTTVARGVYRGHPLVLTAMPDVPLGPGDDELVHYNRLVVRLFGVTGAVDWRVILDRGRWAVTAADPALSARLEEAGVADVAGSLHLPHDAPLAGISFDSGRGHLEVNADAGAGIVPSRHELEILLDATLRLAALNEAVNARPAG